MLLLDRIAGFGHFLNLPQTQYIELKYAEATSVNITGGSQVKILAGG